MSNRELLIHEVQQVSEATAAEVLDFLQFLQSRHRQTVPSDLLASETALSKDWLTPEEDEAWKDL